MSVRTTRRVVFWALVFVAPAPLLVLTRAWMPPATYALYAGVCASVAAFEGSAGPIPALTLMFAAHAAFYGLVAWLAAWVVARAMSGLTPALRRNLTLAAIATALVVALGWSVYRTPFARAPTSNLLEALT